MSTTLLRTARSTVLSVARDFACAILTADGRLLSVAESVPIHVYGAAELMAEVLVELHPDLAPGDAFLHNSPYHGGSHASDWSVLVPVIDGDGVHRFTVIAMAHVSDTGNAKTTGTMAYARDVYEEGALIFPCVRLQRGGRDIEDVLRMCEARVRLPELLRGDLLAVLGAARTGERRLLGLIEEVGPDRLDQHVEAWFDYSESAMVAALETMPAGVSTVRSRHDPFPGFPSGIPVNVTVTMDPEAGRVEVDLTDNLDNQQFGLNLTHGTSRSAALIGVYAGLPADVPVNHGSLRRVTVHLRENCIVGIPRHPASCSLATSKLSELVSSGVARAIAELADGVGLADAGRPLPASCGFIAGRDPRDGGRAFLGMLLLGATHGPGSPSADGWLTFQGMGTCGVTAVDSVEIDELKFPIVVHERRIEANSEGAGRFRGSPASRVEIGPFGTAEIQLSYRCDGTETAPRGVHGGRDGGRMRTLRRDADCEPVELPAFGQVTLRAGQTLISVCNGGGGYGPAHERDPALVRQDVSEGIIDAQRAREVYGVVLADDGSVADSATRALRSRSP
jgi:N-methylhydantoinase B